MLSVYVTAIRLDVTGVMLLISLNVYVEVTQEVVSVSSVCQATTNNRSSTNSHARVVNYNTGSKLKVENIYFNDLLTMHVRPSYG